MLPWFSNGKFPLYLAPMAGVSDKIFRQLCKERGADVLVTEFVSAEGVFRRNARTRGYLEFDSAIERPIGVQLFGGNAEHMAEAAKQVIEWVQPDFIDLNFGCPVNKVVAKNGGSALLKDCPTLAKVVEAVVKAVSPLPVTAKIRTGWDDATINATQVAIILESLGIAAVAVHGRTRAQGYSGVADWELIARVAEAVAIPVIGNGDLFSAADVAQRAPRIRNRRRHDRTCGDELALDFFADETLPRDRCAAPATRAGGEMATDSAALPARGRRMRHRRPRHALDARTVDGVFERNAREQDASGKIPARLVVRRSGGNCAPPSGNLPRSGLNSPVSDAAAPNGEIKFKIGNERLVKVTEDASRKLNSLLQKQGRAHGALRVAVIGGGCSGLQYKMDLVDGPANRDIMVESQNVRVVVDPKSALFVSGSVLDYSDDLQKGGFKVTNPNAVAHCSCGESFSA